MEQELITEQVSEQASESVNSASVEQLNQNYEALVKQQQAQIEQLMKQQEITNKVNQQLTKKVAQLSESQTVNESNEHWIDKVLKQDFDYRIRYDLKTEGDKFLKDSNSAKQLASWWLQYNKSKGLSNEEIATKYKKMAEVMQGAVHSEDV